MMKLIIINASPMSKITVSVFLGFRSICRYLMLKMPRPRGRGTIIVTIGAVPLSRERLMAMPAGRSPGFRVILRPRLPAPINGTVDTAGIVGGYSCASATDFHRLPVRLSALFCCVDGNKMEGRTSRVLAGSEQRYRL